MQCDFAPDFFNNVAAIAAVLMFTKVVTHRSHEVPPSGRRKQALAWVHLAAVAVASITIAASLIATQRKSTWPFLLHVAWVGLVLTGAALIVDILVDELHTARPHSKEPSA